MDVELIRENEDGSTDYHVNMSNEEQAQLFRFAFIELLKRGIAEGKQHEPTDDLAPCVYGGCIKTGQLDKACVCDTVDKVAY